MLLNVLAVGTILRGDLTAAAGHRRAHLSMWALPELVEAATRTGNTGLARDALRQLSEWTQSGRTGWGLGVEARSRALLGEGEAADLLYLEAIDRLGRSGVRPDLARAHLLYGEWLRRQRRSGEARVQLRTAHGLLDAMGAEAFAARAGIESQRAARPLCSWRAPARAVRFPALTQAGIIRIGGWTLTLTTSKLVIEPGRRS